MLYSNTALAHLRTGGRPTAEVIGRIVLSTRHIVQEGCCGPNCWEGSRLSRHTAIVRSWMAPSRYSFLAMLCTGCIVLFASEASAQCTARDVLQNRLTLKKTPSAKMAATSSQFRRRCSGVEDDCSRDVFDSFALRNALDAAGCDNGNSAGEVLARPAFTLSATKTEVELFAVSAAELGFQTDTASLADIYARAQHLGFGLAAAEVAPQLRLQYFDQPIGEFLIVGMEPIKTWNGEPVILTVANGGAGLILIGHDGTADENTRRVPLLCVRSNEAT